jgi:hypothetical protein
MSDLILSPRDGALLPCLQQIEQKLAWGSSDDWKTQDFERLSGLIADKTGVQLSSSTLKRVWGKVRYNSSPNLSTLDALAQFLDYQDWRQFKVQCPVNDIPKPLVQPQKQKKHLFLVLIPLLLIALSLVYFGRKHLSSPKPLHPEDFSFSSRPLAKGLPNSVVFEYNAEKAPEGAKIELQQNWDERRRSTISRTDKVFTSIYYEPGYFEAKLLVNGQVVKEHPVFIPSEGWLGLVEGTEKPLYFKESEIRSKGYLSITPELLKAKQLNPEAQEVFANFSLVQSFSSLYTDHFTFETVLKNESTGGPNACQQVNVMILCEGEVIMIPLAIKGCAAINRLYVPGKLVDGKTNDLSAFSSDFKDWVQLCCEAKAGKIHFFVDQKQVYTLPLSKEKIKIVGLRYLFQGAGSIREARLWNGAGKLVLNEKGG